MNQYDISTNQTTPLLSTSPSSISRCYAGVGLLLGWDRYRVPGQQFAFLKDLVSKNVVKYVWSFILVFIFPASVFSHDSPWVFRGYFNDSYAAYAACESDRVANDHIAGCYDLGSNLAGLLVDFEGGVRKHGDEELWVYKWSCPAGSYADTSGKCVLGDKDEGDSCDDQRGGTNPINLGVGNKYQTEADYVGGGVFPLSVSRTFNSISGAWQFLTEVRLNTAGTIAIVVRRDGKKLPFNADGVGGWISDPDVTGSLASFTEGAGAVTAWRYTTLDKTVEDYNASGKLLSITDRSGLSHAYAHTATDITVTHNQGDVLVYQLDTNGRITGFITPDNDQYSYGYDIADNLISISYPNSGGTRTYHYEDTYSPNALTGITDANGARFATWAYDSLGRAVSSEHNGGAEKVTIDYTYLENATDPRSTATNVLGKQTTYHFTTVHGVRRVVRVEGHPSANCVAANKNYTYDANGFLASKTDWRGNTTTYVRNAKGQELSRTEAAGQPEARTITTEWHPTFNLRVKVTEPDRETTYTYDANGNLLNQKVTSTAGP